MKLITLNIWGGHILEPLLGFIASHQDVDIFCLQEVYHNARSKTSDDDRQVRLNIFSELQTLLPDHVAFFRPVIDDGYGMGMFVKKGIEVIGEGDVLIHENPNYPGRGPTHSRKLQWIECPDCFILNVHGLWNGMGKTDSPARLDQSKKIRDFLDSINKPKILCGDFNLRPDTQSMKIIQKGMVNLIQKHNIHSTRTRLYTKEERFADYILVSPEIRVRDFKKMQDEISDHAPLFLEFGIH